MILAQRARRVHRGMASVMAMIFLMLIAALAVGFYASIEMGDTVADNEQYVHHSMTASESALNFGRYQLSQISLPTGTTQANLMTNLATALGTNLVAQGNTYTSATQPSGSAQYITIPSQTTPGWTPASAASSTHWMNVDALGGQAYLVLGQVANSTNLYLEAVGQNTNARVTPVTRKVELDFATGVPPILSYGMVSYGELHFNNNVYITGSGGGVLVDLATVPAQPGLPGLPGQPTGQPISLTKTSTFSGDLFYTSSYSTLIGTPGWNSGANYLYVDDPTGSTPVTGYKDTSGSNWTNHVHPNTPAPPAPTVDTSNFAQYVTSQYGGGPLIQNPAVGSNVSFSSTLTNTELTANAQGSTYTFNNPVTINGILYIDNNVTQVSFNGSGTNYINGCIVQQTPITGSSCSVVFNSTVLGSSISALSGSNFPPGEKNLSGSFVLLPNGTVKFNQVTSVGTMLAQTITFNAAATLSVTNGSLVALGSGGIVFNGGPINITITTATQAPAGILAGGKYNANSSSYTEVYP